MRQRRKAVRSQTLIRDRTVQRTRHTAERRNQRILYLMAGGLGIFLLALLLGGFYFSVFNPPRKSVAKIGEVDIRLADVRDRTQLMGRLAGVADPQQALNRLIRDEVLQQRAPIQFGVFVTPQEIDESLVQQFEDPSDPNDEESLPPLSLTPDGQALYQDFLDRIKINDSEYRDHLEGELLQERVNSQVALQMPDNQEQVYVYVIAAGSKEANEKAMERLVQGEEFGALANELNQGISLAKENGEIGWMPRGIWPELNNELFSAVPDQFIGPLDSRDGSIVIKVTEGPELQPLSSNMRGILGDNETAAWLQSQLNQLLVGYFFNDSDRQWVLDKLS